MTNERELYKPGDTVPETGIYEVFHDNVDGHEHSPPHRATALQGMVFPPCRACHEHARFRLYCAADHLETHHHFRR